MHLMCMCVFYKLIISHLIYNTFFFSLLENCKCLKGESHALACPKGGSVEFYNGARGHDQSLQIQKGENKEVKELKYCGIEW